MSEQPDPGRNDKMQQHRNAIERFLRARIQHVTGDEVPATFEEVDPDQYRALGITTWLTRRPDLPNQWGGHMRNVLCRGQWIGTDQALIWHDGTVYGWLNYVPSFSSEPAFARVPAGSPVLTWVQVRSGTVIDVPGTAEDAERVGTGYAIWPGYHALPEIARN